LLFGNKRQKAAGFLQRRFFFELSGRAGWDFEATIPILSERGKNNNKKYIHLKAKRGAGELCL